MFENTTNFDFDDDVLSNSFAPTTSSTQRSNTTNNPRNNENKPSKCDKSLNNPRVLKRKFPGPAGLLPDRNDTKNTLFDEINQQNMTLTQFLSSESALTSEGPYEEIRKDFTTSHNILLTEKFSISWVKRQARSSKLTNQKTPFLAGIIQNIEVTDSKTPTVNLTLIDATGQIHGTITYELYEKYSQFLVIGTALILTDLGVLTTGFDSHYVIILPENLCCIYYVKTSKESDKNEEKSSVEKIVLKTVRTDEILKKFEEKKCENKNVVAKNVKKSTEDIEKIPKNDEVLKNLLEGVDLDALLGDF